MPKVLACTLCPPRPPTMGPRALIEHVQRFHPDVVESVATPTPGEPQPLVKPNDVAMRPLPTTTSVCQLCKRPIVWATTVAKLSGPGGKAQPFDPVEHQDGNVAVWPVTHGRLVARALTKGDVVDRPVEYQAMPHIATCTKRAAVPAGVSVTEAMLPPGVADLAAERRKRRGGRRR